MFLRISLHTEHCTAGLVTTPSCPNDCIELASDVMTVSTIPMMHGTYLFECPPINLILEQHSCTKTEARMLLRRSETLSAKIDKCSEPRGFDIVRSQFSKLKIEPMSNSCKVWCQAAVVSLLGKTTHAGPCTLNAACWKRNHRSTIQIWGLRKLSTSSCRRFEHIRCRAKEQLFVGSESERASCFVFIPSRLEHLPNLTDVHFSVQHAAEREGKHTLQMGRLLRGPLDEFHRLEILCLMTHLSQVVFRMPPSTRSKTEIFLDENPAIGCVEEDYGFVRAARSAALRLRFSLASSTGSGLHPM